MWPSGALWDCMGDAMKTRVECERDCTSNYDCGAFSRKSNISSEKASCCLYKEGNVGNGEPNEKCFIGTLLIENISLQSFDLGILFL